MTTARHEPDRRLGERWTRLQWCRNLLIRALARVVVALADRLPSSWLEALGGLAGRAAYRLLGASRRRAERHAALALAQPSAARVARGCFERAGRHLGLSLLLRRPQLRAQDLIDISHEALAPLSAALAGGRGAIVVSAHLGPFEFIPAALAERGVATAVVVRESYDPALDSVLNQHRHARGIQVILRGAASAPAQIVHALRANKALGLLPDIGARVESVAVDLCGRRVLIPVGPQRLALRLGLPLLVGVLEPTTRRGNAHFRGTLRYALRFEALALAADEQLATAQVAGALSQRILHAPEHWLWMAPGREPGGPERRATDSTGAR